MKFQKILSVFILVGSVSFLGGLITEAGRPGWYEFIKLPTWAPEGSVIGIAWTLIFTLLIVSMINILNIRERIDASRFLHIKRWFLINLVLNLLWSATFFGAHMIGLAIIVAALLGLSVFILIYLIRPVSRLSAACLYPYAIWTTFATVLNYFISTLN